MPEEFPVKVRVEVRFRDLDPLGHVNNAVHLSYMELARIRYFQRISPDWLEEGHFVVARMEVDYLRPILLGDEVFVGVRTWGSAAPACGWSTSSPPTGNRPPRAWASWSGWKGVGRPPSPKGCGRASPRWRGGLFLRFLPGARREGHDSAILKAG